MNGQQKVTHHLAFSAGQRRALTVVLAVLIVYAGVRYVMHRSYISDPPPARGQRFLDLADKIDPNTADWPELAALPSIGEKRAKAIIAWREVVKKRDPNAVAYTKLEDLFWVEGFAHTLIEQSRPYLEFPATQPAK